MKVFVIRTCFFIMLCCFSGSKVFAQEGVFTTSRPNLLAATFGTLFFSEYVLAYTHFFETESKVNNGISLGVGAWVDFSLWDYNEIGQGAEINLNYVLHVHPTEKKKGYFEMNFGAKFLYNNGTKNKNFYPFAHPNATADYKYMFIPAFSFGTVREKSRSFTRFGLGYPSLFYLGFGLRLRN